MEHLTIIGQHVRKRLDPVSSLLLPDDAKDIKITYKSGSGTQVKKLDADWLKDLQDMIMTSSLVEGD